MFDWTFFLIIPPLIFAWWAQAKTRGTYLTYSKVFTSGNITGAEAAQKILASYGVNNIRVNMIKGELTDNFDPVHKVLNLSGPVFSQSSIAAVGIAAHEAGHALQHARGYSPVFIRNSLVPVANFTSWMAVPLFIIGILFSFPILIRIGILLFAGVVAFHLITLPVEFDASKRAIKILRQGSYLTAAELDGASKVLSAAALTYVAAALMAIMQLLRLILISRGRN
jgi:hypothetical protein